MIGTALAWTLIALHYFNCSCYATYLLSGVIALNLFARSAVHAPWDLVKTSASRGWGDREPASDNEEVSPRRGDLACGSQRRARVAPAPSRIRSVFRYSSSAWTSGCHGDHFGDGIAHELCSKLPDGRSVIVVQI